MTDRTRPLNAGTPGHTDVRPRRIPLNHGAGPGTPTLSPWFEKDGKLFGRGKNLCDMKGGSTRLAIWAKRQSPKAQRRGADAPPRFS